MPPQPLPPRQVPYEIVGHHPELLLPSSAPAGTVRELVGAASDLAALVGAIQQQGQPSSDGGWARLEPITLPGGKPAEDSTGEPIERLRLTDTTLAAAAPAVAQVRS